MLETIIALILTLIAIPFILVFVYYALAALGLYLCVLLDLLD
jgi:hypothetical protein